MTLAFADRDFPDGAYRIEDFAGAGRIIVAVSGGSDSTALLVSLHQFLRSHLPAVEIVAVTVDHGLRAESAAEADGVGALAAGLGIRHVVRRWDGPKPATGLSEAARLARYRLLADAAREMEAGLLVTGHTLDDQIETVAMRAARGGGRGLAGMAPATFVDGRWMLRPLLGTSRAALRAYLRRLGRDWIDDPSNDDPAFERVRVRQRLEGQPGERRRLAALQTAAARERILESEAAAALIDRHARLAAPGLVRLDRALWQAGQQDAVLFAFRALLSVLGGREQLADAEKAAPLFARLAEPGRRGVLSRTLADSRKGGVYLLREARDVPPADAVLGDVWDGRFRSSPGQAGLRAGHPSPSPAAFPADVPQSLVAAALRTEPSASRPDPPRRILSPWATFLPCFDLAAAQALARLFGLPPFPRPPCSSRIDPKA